MIDAVLQELIEQIAIGAVDLDAVEASALRVLGALAIAFDDRRGFHRAAARAARTYSVFGRTRLTLPSGFIALDDTGSSPSR